MQALARVNLKRRQRELNGDAVALPAAYLGLPPSPHAYQGTPSGKGAADLGHKCRPSQSENPG